ncbi:MAG TPA: peptide chain release factor aRF-1 [Candidatus Nanoarchaeia archaeon]|nr:peptide chain release factor aRF-1 [Candidatus Nanoarchaeia archaeon]
MALKQQVKLSSMQRYQLRKFVKQLASYRGRHTELVTVYVPVGYDLVKVIQHLAQEQGTAGNIKSTSTRKNVQDALEKMIGHLRLYKCTPPHGLLVFSGNVSDREGVSDVRVWSIEPPIPLDQRLYRCDKEFVLDFLNDLVAHAEVYGLVVMDRRDAMLALLRGKAIVPLMKTHSEVPGKMRAGGQSAQRFARIREGAIKDHYKKIADHMKENFLPMIDLKGIIMGGPEVTVNDFLNHDYLTGDIKKKIIGVRALSYTGEFGMHELLERSQDLLAAEEVGEEKAIMQKFFQLLATKQAMVSYGRKEVEERLKMGMVETLLLSADLDDASIDALQELANTQGTEVRLISTDTREGVQLRDMGKVVAILRYAVEY